MKTMQTSTAYNRAFWNFQRGQTYDVAELNTVRGENPTGYFLPDESADRFRAEQEKMNVIRQIGTVLFTESGDKKIKVVLPSGAAGFVSEGGVIPEMDANIASYTVYAHKIAKIAKVSTELISDAGFDLEGALTADFGREFGNIEEKACIGGSGVGLPYGLLHPDKGAETGVTVSSATGITFDNISALYFSLAAEYRRGGSWLMSDETAFYLRKLKDNNGNPLWRNNDDSIFSRPVYTSPYMPGIEAGSKPILFGDFRFYWFIERGGVTLKPLRERYAVQGVTGFVGTEFIDGRLVRRDAVKALEM